MNEVPDNRTGQAEYAPFWTIEVGRAVELSPIDDRALYGYPVLGERGGADVIVRRRGLVTAICVLGARQEVVHHDDRVRVNDGPWMKVLPDDDFVVDEGFLCVPENGSAVRAVKTRNGRDRPPGTWNDPWMRRVDDWASMGEVFCLEVDWAEEGRS